MPVPVVAWSKARVYGRSLAGCVSSSPAGSRGFMSLVTIVCSEVEVSASSRGVLPSVACLSVIVRLRF